MTDDDDLDLDAELAILAMGAAIEAMTALIQRQMTMLQAIADESGRLIDKMLAKDNPDLAGLPDDLGRFYGD